MSARQKILAALISLPSAAALIAYLVIQMVAALGNPSVRSGDVVPMLFFATMLLQPLSTFIALGWVIASWANHGRVPPWLLWLAVGNGAVFFLWYCFMT